MSSPEAANRMDRHVVNAELAALRGVPVSCVDEFYLDLPTSATRTTKTRYDRGHVRQKRDRQNLGERVLIHTILEAIAGPQLREPPVLLPSTPTSDELFDFYRQSSAPVEILNEKHQREIENPEEHFKDYVVGRVFQDLGYLFFKGQVDEDQLLLSPDNTLQVYKALHPKAAHSTKPFGLDSVEGISVPDGLVVGEDMEGLYIAGLVEYSSHTTNTFEVKQTGIRLASRRFPGIFSKSLPLHIVRPAGYNGLGEPVLESSVSVFHETPFSSRQFTDFLASVQDESGRPLVDYIF